MKLNQLSPDGMRTWINLAFGPCSDERCQQKESTFYVCRNHTTYECIKILLDNKIRLHVENELEYAIHLRYIKIIKLLLNTENSDFNIYPLIDLATDYGYIEILKLLEQYV